MVLSNHRRLFIAFGTVGLALAALVWLLSAAITPAFAADVEVCNLQPDFAATGGGGVYSAYYGPPAYGPVSPGTTTVYQGRPAGIIKAGLAVDPTSLVFEDEGLFGFKPTVTINAFAAGTLTYDVQNQAGVNPVWMTIEIDTGVVNDRSDNTAYQFVPTSNPAGWNTFNAGAGLWLQWTTPTSGITVGSPMTLSAVATANTGLNVVRTYLRLGMGNSYSNGGTGTIAWVDKATLGGVTYDFAVCTPPGPMAVGGIVGLVTDGSGSGGSVDVVTGGSGSGGSVGLSMIALLAMVAAVSGSGIYAVQRRRS